MDLSSPIDWRIIKNHTSASDCHNNRPPMIFGRKSARERRRLLIHIRSTGILLILSLVASTALGHQSSAHIQPSQLFLPAQKLQTIQPISLVEGFNQKRPEEEDDGFIMQAVSSSNTTTNNQTTPMTITTATIQMEATTLAEDEDDARTEQTTSTNDDRIPIDSNRRQFLTHDQLTSDHVNQRKASDRFEQRRLLTNEDETKAIQKVQSSRAGMSKVSHVGSFFSDLISYATKTRVPAQQEYEQQSDEQQRTQSTATTTSSRQQSFSTCPGVCRNILTASVFCRNEINAPCPSVLQKCCDKDDVSFNGTPVETSAPLSNPDNSDTNSAPLSHNLHQAQDQASLNSQTGLPTTPTSFPFATQSTTTTTTTTTTTATDHLSKKRTENGTAASDDNPSRTGSEHPHQTSSIQPGSSSSIYIWSSINGSEELSDSHSTGDRYQTMEPASSGGRTTTTKRAQQQSSVAQSIDAGAESAPIQFDLRQQQTSQSFDQLLSSTPMEQSITIPSLKVTTESPSKIVVVQTANGTILHQPRRPIYANRTDYQLLLMQMKPTQAGNVVYHSNIDPVKKLLPTLEPTVNSTTTSTGHPISHSDMNTTSSSNDTRSLCTGICIHRTQIQLCQSHLSPNYHYRCNSESELCCTKVEEVSANQSRDNHNNDDKDTSVLNDQHSSISKNRAKSTQATPTTTTPQPTTTTTTTTEAPTTTAASPSYGGVGDIIVGLLDTWIGGDQKQTDGMKDAQSSDSHSSSFSPNDQQNDRRFGLSFRQNNNEAYSNNNLTNLNDGSILEEGFSGGDLINGEQQANCSGYCAMPLFTMLCDRSYKSSHCGPYKECCIVDRSIDSQQQQSDYIQKQHQSTIACNGNCLPNYLSTLCMKPKQILLDTGGCAPNQVCCGPPIKGDNNHLEETSLSSSLADPMIYAGSHDYNTDHQVAKDNALLAALVPPPPPTLPVTQDQQQQQQTEISSEQYLPRQRQPSTVDPSMQMFSHTVIPTARPTIQQQGTTKSTASTSPGFMSQIYQMFRSGGSSKQRQRQPPAPQLIPAQQSVSFMNQLFDPYQAIYGLRQTTPVTAPTNILMAPPGQPALMMSPSQYASSYGLDTSSLSQQHQPQIQPQAKGRLPANQYHQGDQILVQQQLQQPVMHKPMNSQATIGSNNFLIPTTNNVQASQINGLLPVSMNENNQHQLEQQQQQQQMLINMNHQQQQQQQQQIHRHYHQQQIQPQQMAQQITKYQHDLAQNDLSHPQQIGQRFYHHLDNTQQPAANQNQLIPQQVAKNPIHVPPVNQPNPLYPSAGLQSPAPVAAQKQQTNKPEQVNRPTGNGAAQLRPNQQQQSLEQKGFVGLAPIRNVQVESSPTQRPQQRFSIRQNTSTNTRPKQSAANEFLQQQQQQSASGNIQSVRITAGNNINRVTSSNNNNDHNKATTATTSLDLDHTNNRADKETAKDSTKATPNTEHTNLNSLSSNINVHFSNDLIGVSSPNPLIQSDHQAQWSTTPTSRRPALTNSGSRDQIGSKKPVPVNYNRDDDFQGTTVAHNQQTSCPSSNCLSPMSVHTCLKPNYIDTNLACAQTGALCCINVGSTSQDDIDEQLHSTTNAVDNNKLELSTTDSDDQSDSEPGKQQNDGGETVDTLEDSSVQQTKSKALSCGLPGISNVGRRISGQAKGRVMGGTEARPGHWCWQAALMNDKNEYLCGGALIGTKWVLTAAHCITQHLRNENNLFVRLGQHNLNSSISAKTAKSIKVKTSYVHHNHNGVTLDNDVALLRLDNPVDLDSSPSICLVCLPERNSHIDIGKRCVVTGYGFENENGPAALRIRQTELPIVADQDCQKKTSSVLGKPFTLPASSFCAGGELGQDACHGDGGSPLSCLVDGYYELAGIVSWGYKCGNKDLPGLYSKVSTFVGWINQIVSVNN